MEDGTVADKADEGDEEEEGAPGASAHPDAPAGGSAAAQAAAPAPAADAAQAPAAVDAPAAGQAPGLAAAQGGLDGAALTQQLTGLVGQIKGALAADPSRAEALKGLAVQAQAGLKSGDLQAAQSAIAQLHQALQQAGGAQPANGGQVANGAQPADGAKPANGAASPNVQALAKARLAWSATRTKVEGELDKLHAEMSKHYKEHGFGDDLEKTFTTKVQPMMSKLDESLSSKLDEITSSTDSAQHTKLVGEAKQILQKYNAYLTQEPMVAKLDSNPFVPMTVHKTLTATLSALERVVA